MKQLTLFDMDTFLPRCQHCGSRKGTQKIILLTEDYPDCIHYACIHCGLVVRIEENNVQDQPST